MVRRIGEKWAKIKHSRCAESNEDGTSEMRKCRLTRVNYAKSWWPNVIKSLIQIYSDVYMCVKL
jgi:hypothetical protein